MSPDLSGRVGGLTAAEVAATGRTLAALQEPDGALPWTVGGHTDAWNHVEATMGLHVAGEWEVADRAWTWLRRAQRPDGSWPIRVVTGRVEDDGTESNMTAYVAVGVWHHWLVRRDPAFLHTMWPVVRRALDLVCAMQLPFGGIAWTGGSGDALLAGSSSIHHALRAGLTLAELVGQPQPEWELTAGRLGHALAEHREAFLDKETFAMDWYYPVLGGALRGAEGVARLASRWDDFVVPGLGVRCVDTNPWVTAAETAELVLALDALGDRDRARSLFAGLARLRDTGGGYWTGCVYPDEVVWPRELTCYTAAAVLLAHDALTGQTPGADVVRGVGLVPAPGPLALECACGQGAEPVSTCTP